MEAALDVFRVLYEPGKVFERVRERPRVLVPWIVLSLILVVIMYMMLPYIMDASAASIAKAEARSPGGGQTARTMIPILRCPLNPLPMNLTVARTIKSPFIFFQAK